MSNYDCDPISVISFKTYGETSMKKNYLSVSKGQASSQPVHHGKATADCSPYAAIQPIMAPITEMDPIMVHDLLGWIIQATKGAIKHISFHLEQDYLLQSPTFCG